LSTTEVDVSVLLSIFRTMLTVRLVSDDAPTSALARASMSSAARRVNVSSRMRSGATPRSSNAHTRAVSARVLPLPAPAKTFARTARNNYIDEFIFNKLDRLFDVAVMMDCSQCPLHPQLKGVFKDYAKKNAETVRKHGARPVYFMSWAYQDVPAMTAQLAEEYTKAGNTYKFTDKMATWYARFSQASTWTPPGEWRSQAAIDSLANAQKFFVADNAFVWPADYATDVDQTTAVYRAWVYKFITGQATMDQWQQYVDEYNAAGGAHMTEYARTVLK